MDKVLLVTLQGANIGNRLQNYALQTVLEKIGYEVYNPIYKIKEPGLNQLKSLIKRLLYIVGYKKYAKIALNNKRKSEFKKFTDKYIKNQIKIFDFKTDKIKNEKYKFAITGSDQVWHKWTTSPKELSYFYLQFIEEDKRISYAPSFGFQEIPAKDLNEHIEGIRGIRIISCREKTGAQIVMHLTNRTAEIVPDPTILLTKEEWKALSEKPKKDIPSKYVLVYFLGEKNSEYMEAINRICTERNCVQIDIFSEQNPDLYCTDPSQFIWLIEHADYICTDSFHACVFSIIFEKCFTVFPRKEDGMENMFDRVECLLQDFGLMDCIWEKDNFSMCRGYNAVFIEELLKDKANQGIGFLMTAMNK